VVVTVKIKLLFDKFMTESAMRYKVDKDEVINLLLTTLESLGLKELEVDDNKMILFLTRTMSYIVVMKSIASGNITNFEDLLAYKLLGPKGEIQ
jgi:hypothetical protein